MVYYGVDVPQPSKYGSGLRTVTYIKFIEVLESLAVVVNFRLLKD
jgi:hypothetical protein